MTTTTVSTDDLDFLPVASENKVDTIDETKFFAVVFVGDILTLAQKSTPMKRLGGRLFPDSLCLRNQLVPRCAITPLEEGMMKVHAALVNEKERDQYISEFRKTNVPVWDPVQMRKVLGAVVVGNRPENKDILYKRLPPAREIGRIAQNGVVVVPSIRSVADIRDAQYHYFPKWNRLVQGAEMFPTRLAELEDYIRGRMSQARTKDLVDVGQAYLQSSQEFRIWGSAYVKFQTEAIKKAEGTAGIQTYDEIAERLFGMLDLTREDKLVADLAQRAHQSNDQTGQITTALTMLAEILSRTQDPEIPRVPVATQFTEGTPDVQTATPPPYLGDSQASYPPLQTPVTDAAGPSAFEVLSQQKPAENNTPLTNITVSDLDLGLPVVSEVGSEVAGDPNKPIEEKILPPPGLGVEGDIEVEG